MKKLDLNNNNIESNILEVFDEFLQEKLFSKAKIIFAFGESGSYSLNFDIDGFTSILEPRKVRNINENILWDIEAFFKKQFNQLNARLGYKPDVQKWNKAIFEYSKDGTLKSEYVWDNDQKIEEEKSTAYHFCHWLQGRLTTMMFEESGFDKKKWDRAIGEFWINNQDVSFVGKAFNKRNQESPINISLESWDVRKALIEHYEITNNGILKEFWQPWNKLTIRVFQDDYFRESEHTDYSLDKGDGIATKIEGLPVRYN